MIQDFLHIESINDLNRVLSSQQAITRSVLEELDRIAGRLLPESFDTMTERDAEKLWLKLRRAQVMLLKRYADLPTLTEFSETPALRGLSREGGTFGVAAVVGEVLLTMIGGMEPNFPAVHRLTMLLLFGEMNLGSTARDRMVDAALGFIHFDLAETIAPEQQHALVRSLVAHMIDAILTITTEYQLIESAGESLFTLTPLGRRTLLHMFDTERFIDTVAKAHRRLQEPQQHAS